MYYGYPLFSYFGKFKQLNVALSQAAGFLRRPSGFLATSLGVFDILYDQAKKICQTQESMLIQRGDQNLPSQLRFSLFRPIKACRFFHKGYYDLKKSPWCVK